MRRQIIEKSPFLVLLVGIVLCSSCTSRSKDDRPTSANSQPATTDATIDQSAPSKPIPTGPLMADKIVFEFAIYYLPEPSTNPQDELDRLLKDKFPAFQKVEQITENTREMALAARLISDVKKSYAPPDLESLQHFGRGLSREQAVALQDSKSAFQIIFSYPKEYVWDGMRSALQLTGKLAEATNGLLWDEETRELFSVEQWNKNRLQDWTDDVPDISKHMIMHAYNKDECVRAITLGMAKFGLPDIVVDNFSWSISRNVGHVIIFFAQAMAEGAVLQKPGEFDLDLKAIKAAKVREWQTKPLLPHATGTALLSLSEGVPEEGDPKNRIIAVTFDRYPGPDPPPRRRHPGRKRNRQTHRTAITTRQQIAPSRLTASVLIGPAIVLTVA